MSMDRKTLLLGFLLGNIAGLMLLCSTYPEACRFLEVAFPYGAGGYYTSDFALMITVACGLLIFPSTLTLTAPRFYCFWGLLPLSIFFLWLVAGSCIAHRLRNLVDPFWIVPVLFLGTWAIASFPISLFRWVRSRRGSSVAIIQKPAPRFRRYLVPTVTATLLLPIVFIGWHNLKHPKPLSANVNLRWDKDKDAVVPLTVRNGGIFVMASLDGEEQLCRVDTGSDTVNWFHDLHIKGEMTQERGEACGAVNNCVFSSVVKLPVIKIGSYQVTGLPTCMLDSKSGLFSSVPASDAAAEPLLGNALFSLAVLTVDYQHKRLAIRPATYDFTKKPRRPGDKVVQMGWTSHTEDSPGRQQVFGWPAIRARVCGRPFWCVIDTGWEGQELGIDEHLVSQLPTLRQVPRSKGTSLWAYSTASVPQLDHLSFQVPTLPPHAEPITLQGRGMIVNSIGGGQGIIGTNLMEQYRITIDYQRRRVLLEPYAHNVPGQKQENGRKVANVSAS